MTKRHVVLLAAFVLFPLMAWAGVVIEAYAVLGARPSEDVTDGDANESDDLATPLAGRVQSTRGNPTIAVTCEMSASGATVLITVALLDKDGAVTGLHQSTATATRFRTAAAGDYVTQTLMFDSMGAPKYEVRHDDPSTGTVDIRAWVLGSQPE